MNAEQLDLPVKLASPEVGAAEIAAVCDFLRGQGWQTARQLTEKHGIDDRRIRSIAEHSDGRILSGPGCPGYKLFTGATEVGEADQCASRLESQARKMLQRASSIRKRYHRYARPVA